MTLQEFCEHTQRAGHIVAISPRDPFHDDRLFFRDGRCLALADNGKTYFWLPPIPGTEAWAHWQTVQKKERVHA